MIDRITGFKKGDSAKALKSVTFSDDVIYDHFPDYPILPGSFLIESMAQLSGFLIEMTYNTKARIRRAVLAQVDCAKFHNPAEPGDTVAITAHLSERMEDAAKVSLLAEVDGEKIASAKLTFVLKEIDSAKIHEQRRYLYKIWTKHCDLTDEIL